jgi:aryl-alcohol dehydrogenase-like predicted oxidoreductase
MAAINEALDMGIGWIDTAAVYGHGHSEEVIGEVLKSRGSADRPIIATKCSLCWDENHGRICRLKAESIRAECEASLRRLGVDMIDLYQVHWPEPAEDLREAWEEMTRLKEEGKVRYLGASNFSVAQLEEVGKISRCESLQPAYSMVRRGFEGELRGYCEANSIGVIAYSPMQAGLLTGKFSVSRLNELAEDDWRRKNRYFAEPIFSAVLELVDKLGVIAEAAGRTTAELAVAWVINQRAVTGAIVGARRAGQITQTGLAGDWELSEEEINQIDEYLSEYESNIKARL